MASFKPSVWLNSDRPAALAVALAPLLYFLPATRGLTVLCPEDGMFFNVPLRVAAARAVLDGSLPLWNPYIFSGMPLLASAQGGLLFPLNWTYLLFDAPAATNLTVFSSYALAGVGAFLYARRAGSSPAGSLVTALVWQWGGFLVAQLAHVNVVQTAAMLPWVLWALDGYASAQGRGALVSLFVALQAFAGHQQTLAYSLLLVAAYALVSALAQREARPRYLRSLAYVAAGLPLAAVQLIPTYELLRRSLRSEVTYEFFTSFSLPRRFALTFFAPYVLGGGDGTLFFSEPYTGPPFYVEFIAYAGLLALMLAAAALLLRRDARTIFWAAAAAVCFVLALGGNAPLGLSKLVAHVPVINLFRVPARHLMEVEFALAVLAGRGVTALAEMRGGRPVFRLTIVAAGPVFALTCLVVMAFGPAGSSLLKTPERFVPLLVAGASALALWHFARAGRGGAFVLVCVLAVDLLVWGQASGWRTSSPGTDHPLWTEPETINALRELAPGNPASYRILTAPHWFDPSVAPVPPSVSRSQDWVPWTLPDIYMLYGIHNAAGYDGFGLARYSRLAGEMKVWGELTDPDRTLRGEGREVDILNVRYLLSIRKKENEAGAAGGVEPAGGRWRLATRTGYVDIHENTRALPRAWLAGEGLALEEEETLAAIRTGRLPDGSLWEPLRTALIEMGAPTLLPISGGGSAEVTLYEPNRVEVHCAAEAPSVLVLSENHYPGWHAYVDGRPAEVLRVNYGLRGVVVPAGEHTVEFVYRPASALVGLAVSLLTAAVLAFSAFAPAFSGRTASGRSWRGRW
ncbi:MAG TPA: YfhO family protein [Pyrinomonadaceae bacterium]|nr:YfhO family protein [Pyrinomonadaceae bacterium]